MKTSWFTFGQCHSHRCGNITLDKDIVIKITSEDPRATMVSLFGDKWCFEYSREPDMKYFPRGIYEHGN